MGVCESSTSAAKKQRQEEQPEQPGHGVSAAVLHSCLTVQWCVERDAPDALRRVQRGQPDAGVPSASRGRCQPDGCGILIHIVAQCSHRVTVQPQHHSAATGSVSGFIEAVHPACTHNLSLTLCRVQDGRTPLHIAAYHGNIEAVEAILGANPNVNIKDNVSQAACGGLVILLKCSIGFSTCFSAEHLLYCQQHRIMLPVAQHR